MFRRREGAQASRAAVHPDGHDQHPVHLRWHVRRYREDHRQAASGRRTIGFGQQSGMRGDADVAELLPQVDADDVLQFGLIPELVGRLPVVAALKPLDVPALVRVLREPKNALIKLNTCKNCLAWKGPISSSLDDGLQAIARRAQEKDTGARGLRSIIEEVMLGHHVSPTRNIRGRPYVIDEPVVYRERRLRSQSLNRRQRSRLSRNHTIISVRRRALKIFLLFDGVMKARGRSSPRPETSVEVKFAPARERARHRYAGRGLAALMGTFRTSRSADARSRKRAFNSLGIEERLWFLASISTGEPLRHFDSAAQERGGVVGRIRNAKMRVAAAEHTPPGTINSRSFTARATNSSAVPRGAFGNA